MRSWLQEDPKGEQNFSKESRLESRRLWRWHVNLFFYVSQMEWASFPSLSVASLASWVLLAQSNFLRVTRLSSILTVLRSPRGQGAGVPDFWVTESCLWAQPVHGKWCSIHLCLIQRNAFYTLLLWFSHQIVSDSLRPHGCSMPGFPVLYHLPEFSQALVQFYTLSLI